MKKIQTTFKRYEIKYLLTAEQKQYLLGVMDEHMQLDEYGRSSIRNVYYDTDSFRLIRTSIDKPIYKEKLRVRSYGEAGPTGRVFVELKKKYKGVVYKRRLTMPFDVACTALQPGGEFPTDTQITREIRYFRDFYETLHPAVFLCYDREAYYERDGGDFRVTFDDTIRYRTHDLNMYSGIGGIDLLPEGLCLMELKAPGAIPLWMIRALSAQRIYKTSFSKYGRAYADMLGIGAASKEQKGDFIHA